MSAPNLAVLRAAVAAVRADLSSDRAEDSKSPADRKDMVDDQKLLAALDAVDKAISPGGDSPAPTSLKEAAGRAREQFAAARNSASAGSSK